MKLFILNHINKCGLNFVFNKQSVSKIIFHLISFAFSHRFYAVMRFFFIPQIMSDFQSLKILVTLNDIPLTKIRTENNLTKDAIVLIIIVNE